MSESEMHQDHDESPDAVVAATVDQLLQPRRDAITKLFSTRSRRDEQKKRMDEADAEYAADFAAAQRAGWTTAELGAKPLEMPAPVTKRRTSTPRQKKTPPATTKPAARHADRS